MKLHAGGYLTFYLPKRQSPMEVHLDQPILLIEILQKYRIPQSEVQLVSVNGLQVDLETALVVDLDEVQIISGVDGG